MLRSLLILSALLSLTACEVQSRIQSRYIAQQEKCRDEAQSIASGSTENKSDPSPGVSPVAEDTNQRVVAQFSECMNKNGWHVAVPKPATPLPTNTAQNPPSIFPAPPNLPATAAARAPTTIPSNTPAATGATPTTAPQIGPGSMPNPTPALSPATSPVGVPGQPVIPGQSGAATYQPARPYELAPSPAPNYNAGTPGRNF